jgi:thiamine-monophosphate kinase
MKLSQLGEFGLIKEIRRLTPKGRGVRLGIGDDAAWVLNPTGSSLITTDLLIEGIHFDLHWTSMFDLGFKTLAVNLSDIAAMGGVPAYLLLSLGIPANFDSKKIAEFYRGIRVAR